MTCIVALEAGNRVYLAADSFLGNPEVRARVLQPKMFKVAPGFAIAYAGSVRGAQVLQYGGVFPKQRKNQDDMSYLVSVASYIRDAFEAEGVLVSDREAGQEVSPTLLILALNGKAYVMQPDFGVLSCDSPYVAVGAGAEIAETVLRLRLGDAKKGKALTPAQIHALLESALSITAETTPMVCAPFTTLVV